MTVDWLLLGHLLVFAALQTADQATTEIGMALGARELNPLMRLLMGTLWRSRASKAGGALLLGLFLFSSPPWGWAGPRLADAWELRAWLHHGGCALVVAHNLRVIVALRREAREAGVS